MRSNPTFTDYFTAASEVRNQHPKADAGDEGTIRERRGSHARLLPRGLRFVSRSTRGNVQPQAYAAVRAMSGWVREACLAGLRVGRNDPPASDLPESYAKDGYAYRGFRPRRKHAGIRER